MKTLHRIFSILAGGAALFFLSGCAEIGQSAQGFLGDVTSLKEDLTIWKKTNSYTGIKYRSTDKVVPTFQDRQVPVSCRVFAHLLAYIPEESTGKTLAESVEAEAMTRGADMLLIGGARQATNKKVQEPVFSYYGPAQPYKCRDQWSGWKFAYEEWVNQGEWVSMGYDGWGNPDAHFNFPLIMQVAFLRCLN